MSIFDRFKSKKEKELGKAEAPKEVKGAEKSEKAPKVAKKKEPKTSAAKIDVSGTVKAPVITEKTAHMAQAGQYVFEVAGNATKVTVRIAVEQAYGVHVTSVRIQNVRGKVVRFGSKLGKRSSWKKAIVTLKAGERLDVYEAAAK